MEFPELDDEPALGHRFVIGLLEVDLRIPVCHSLKEKRGILARAANDLRRNLPVVVSEVGHQNDWNRAGLAAVTLSGRSNVVEGILDDVLSRLQGSREIELVHHAIQLL